MPKRALLIILFISISLFAEYPDGYFFIVYDGDTICVEPVITDSTTEAEWFDYDSWSMHTGYENGHESKLLFFYNPFSGNIGFLATHNVDGSGSWQGSCRMWLDGLPSATYRLFSDDEWEFDLGDYPQGYWLWVFNSDGGAILIPREEWTFNAKLRFGGLDPTDDLYFLSGDLGSTRIHLADVSTSHDYNITLGHRFLELLGYPSDSVVGYAVMGESAFIDVGVANSDETVDTLSISGATHTNPLFSSTSVPGELAPGANGNISVSFSGGTVGIHIDTLWAVTNEPCGTNPIVIYMEVMPPAIGYIKVQDSDEIIDLRIIDSTYAESAGHGVIMTKLPPVIGSIDLVDTTNILASPIFIKTPHGIRSWRKKP
ncbi:hypothetical protein KAH81_09430 [bacterium]|nr:hypothetical protein [bacterium]